MSILRIPRFVFNDLRRHGEEMYPHECCGVLVGRIEPGGSAVYYSVRATNSRVDSPQNRYEIAPADLVAILREAQNRGLDIAGFYHSHPDHPAQWSFTDLEEAHWLGCSYVITGVVKGCAQATNAFWLSGATEEDKCFVQQEINLAD